MSDEGAGYFAAAQGRDISREELKEEIEELRANTEISDEDLQKIISGDADSN